MNNLSKKIIVPICIAVVVILFILFDAHFADKETQVLANKPPEEVVQTTVSVPQPIDSTINQAVKEHEVAPLPNVTPETFLEKNGRDPLVNTLASGLQYKVIKQGNGKYPNYSDTVHIVSQLTVLDAAGEERDRLSETGLTVDLSTLPASLVEAISKIDEEGAADFFASRNMAAFMPQYLLGPIDLEQEDTLVLGITLNQIVSEK